MPQTNNAIGLSLIKVHGNQRFYRVKQNQVSETKSSRQSTADIPGQNPRSYPDYSSYYVSLQGTIEEKIYQRQINKQSLGNSIVDSVNKQNVKFSKDELKVRSLHSQLCHVPVIGLPSVRRMGVWHVPVIGLSSPAHAIGWGTTIFYKHMSKDTTHYLPVAKFSRRVHEYQSQLTEC